MNNLLENIHLALPELVILLTACVALVADLFFSKKIKSISFIIAAIGLGMAAFFSFMFLDLDAVLLFNGLFVSDELAQIMKLFVYMAVFASLFYSRRYLFANNMPFGDMNVLALFSTLGMMVLISSHSLLTIYLGLELMSLPLYAMTAMRRADGDASEAAMKYFAMGAIASGMLLYGISLLYAATGHLDLTAITKAISANWQTQGGMVSFALVFVLAGLGFKLATVPFHMWAPDVYQGAPTSATIFISTAPKIAALAMVLRILPFALSSVMVQWQQIILIMALLSVGIGNLVAIAQTNIKRLLAYSGIAHMGFALFGVLAGTSAGYSAALYYVLIYAIMSAGAFGLVVLLSQEGRDIEQISDLKGLSKRSPWLALMMMIVLFSMAGVPPTAGFFTKLLVLKALVDVNMIWVAVLGLLFAVVGAFYYLRLIKVMYFEDADNNDSIKLSRATWLVFSVNCLSLLYWGIFPSALITACVNAFAG